MSCNEEVSEKNCLNCNQPLLGPICSQCGQKEAKPFLTKRVIGDIWTQCLEMDFRFIRSIKELMSKPGLMINDYLQGKRVHYSNPFKLLFIIATLYFIIVQTFDIRVDSFTDSDTANVVVAMLNYLVFIILLPAALYFRWLYGKSRLNYAEAYVSITFIWSGYMFIAVLAALLSLPITEHFLLIRMILGWLYLLYVSQQMFQLKWWTAFWKSLVMYVSYVFTTMLIMGLLITIAHLIGYEPLMLEFPKSNG